MKKFLSLIVLSFLFWTQAIAQCPMCKAVAESARKENPGIGTLNDGIIYLFVVPYLCIAVVGYFWYKQYKKKQQEAEEGLDL